MRKEVREKKGGGIHYYSIVVLEMLLEKLVNQKNFAVSYLSYSESLYDLIIQYQVDLNPFLARKRVGH